MQVISHLEEEESRITFARFFFQLGCSPHLHQGPHQWSSNTPGQAELWTDQSNRSEVVRPGWTLCLGRSQGSQDFLQDHRTWHFLLKICLLMFFFFLQISPSFNATTSDRGSPSNEEYILSRKSQTDFLTYGIRVLAGPLDVSKILMYFRNTFLFCS